MKNQQKLFLMAFCNVFGNKSIYSIINEKRMFKIKNPDIIKTDNQESLCLSILNENLLSITYIRMCGKQLLETYAHTIVLKHSNSQQYYEKELRIYLLKLNTIIL